MNTNPDDFVDVVSCVLTEVGIHSIRIPPSKIPNINVPDLDAHDEDEKYLIEVKVKLSDPVVDRDLKLAHERGEIHQSVRSLSYSSSVNSIIDKAAKQLQDHDSANTKIHILWCDMTGRDERYNYYRFRNTLYGIVNVVEFMSGKSFEALYFDNSALFRNKSKIDAVILTYSGNGTLCLNENGPNISRLVKSKIFQLFKSAVFDPVSNEKAGDVLIVDGEHPRDNDHNSIKYIQEKYKLTTITPIRLKEFAASVAIPRCT